VQSSTRPDKNGSFTSILGSPIPALPLRPHSQIQELLQRQPVAEKV
jgi:hypothetical protein